MGHLSEEMEVEFPYEGGDRAVWSTGRGRAGQVSREDKAFGQQETKDCFVVLHRLDEKLINRYLRKESKRRKRKIRPLSYTDDEDDPVEAKPLKNCSESDRGAQVDSQAMKDTKRESKEMGCGLARTVEGRKEEIPVENGNSSAGGVGCCSAVDNEVEIIKEFPRSFRGNEICDKAVCDVELITQDESKSQELNDLDDSREDGEDDRSTVIFEKDTDLEVIEIEEKEFSNKFKKKKITNRKKQRLVKFKRKSMIGRNLGKIRKSNTKLFESGSGGLDAAEKNVSDCIAEDNLREVCLSVRRLHEMYTIILQLQKEMPKDTELTYHFKRVINAQRENFHREIRRSQKIIIKSFEKMLKTSSNTLDKIALDIGKRTYLTSEEVIYVLSLCMLSEGSCDVDKSRSGFVEKAEQPKSSPSSLRKPRITKKATQAKSCKSKVQPQEVMNTEMPSVAPPLRVGIPPAPVSDHPVDQRSAQSHAPAALVPNSRVQVSRACPQPCNFYQLEKSNQRSHFWPQQNFESARINNSGVRQFRVMNLPQVVRQSSPSTQLPSTMSQYCNVPYTNQNALYPPGPRPSFYSTLHASTGHCQRGSNLPPVQGRTSDLLFRLPSQRQCNYVPDKPNANQTFGSPVLVQNILGYGAVRNRMSESNQPLTLNSVPTITQRSNAFPNLENLRCNVGNGEIILTPTGETQCHLDFTNSVAYHNSATEEPLHERLTVPVEVGRGNTETTKTATTDPEISEVLDPTIPQKLTMKNSRLQAGPTLSSVKSPEERTKRGASENPDQEHSRSRTYICAEDGCKNPGVRICNFCQSVIYCSKICQGKHWNKKHKAECCQLKELRG